MDVLSPFISILCHCDWLFHRESWPRLDVVYPDRTWSSSPACTWHCSLHVPVLALESASKGSHAPSPGVRLLRQINDYSLVHTIPRPVDTGIVSLKDEASVWFFSVTLSFVDYLNTVGLATGQDGHLTQNRVPHFSRHMYQDTRRDWYIAKVQLLWRTITTKQQQPQEQPFYSRGLTK